MSGGGDPAFTPVTLPLRNPPGEHEITLRLTGRMAVAWFRFRDGSN